MSVLVADVGHSHIETHKMEASQCQLSYTNLLLD